MSIRELEVSQKPMHVQVLKARMKEVETALINNQPGIVTAMIDIHKNLQQHEELVHLLNDDDIMLLHQAHEKHKQMHMIVKEEKNQKKAAKKLSNADLSNL
jgi:hypothetical protein